MATYFAHKQKWRVNMSTGSGGPLAPPSGLGTIDPANYGEDNRPRRRGGPTGPHMPRGQRPSPRTITLDPSSYRYDPVKSGSEAFQRAQWRSRAMRAVGRLAGLRAIAGISPQGLAFNLATEILSTGYEQWNAAQIDSGEPGGWEIPPGSVWSVVSTCDQHTPAPHWGTTSRTSSACIGMQAKTVYGSMGELLATAPYRDIATWQEVEVAGTKRYNQHTKFRSSTAYPGPIMDESGWPRYRAPTRNTAIPGVSRPPRSAPEQQHSRPEDRPVPRTPPYGEPSLDVTFVPRGPIRVRVGTHYRIPPPRRQYNERKQHHNRHASYRILRRILSGTGEAIEFVEAFHDALPDRLQCGGCTPQRKLQIVFQNLDKLDGDKVVWNLLTNHGEDWFFGQIGQGSAKVGEENRWIFGPQTGPADTGGPYVKVSK